MVMFIKQIIFTICVFVAILLRPAPVVYLEQVRSFIPPETRQFGLNKPVRIDTSFDGLCFGCYEKIEIYPGIYKRKEL